MIFGCMTNQPILECIPHSRHSKTLRQFRNHELSAVLTWQCQLWSKIGIYYFSGHPAAELLHRTLNAPQLCHCMQIPK